jgi:formylglycine-generating enzyme required for sulfatase activity/tetratricopeptide (TPR) repeat protein
LAISQDGDLTERYAAVWAEPSSEQDTARMYVATSADDHEALCDDLSDEGLGVQRSLQTFRGVDGLHRYCGVRAKVGVASSTAVDQVPPEYERNQRLGQVQWDVSVSLAGKSASTRERYASVLAVTERQLAENPNDLEARVRRAVANYHLNRDREAIEDFDFLIEVMPEPAPIHLRRAVVYARAGDAEQAVKDMETYREYSSDESGLACTDAVVAAYLGQDTEAMERLEKMVEERAEDAGLLYDVACAYSIASRAVVEHSPDESRQFADRAVALLSQAIDNGFRDFSKVQEDPNLDPVRQHPVFLTILRQAGADTWYAAVWQSRRDLCSVELHALEPVEHLSRCRELASQGYRPASVAVGEIRPREPLVAASIWHRPVMTESDKERLAMRQANAAVTLTRLEPDKRIWSLLKHKPDPRVRSWLIHRFGPLGVDPRELVKRLSEEQDVSIRRALILSLGEFPEDALPAVERETLVEELLETYRRDPDPGIHGAAEWLLRQWGNRETMTRIDLELSKMPAPETRGSQGARQAKPFWYVNTQGQTMVVIPGPVEFAMGRPGVDYGASADAWPRKRIGRTFAIAAKRVTVGQYQRFVRETPELSHPYTRKFANLPPDMTQISACWYEAAQYCRWLSEKEGIPEDQMCYPSIREITEGMRLPEDYLHRTGYRLPSEAEWEYACRSGTESQRYYGSTEELLPKYGWYKANSESILRQVGLLKPNDYGLFDMLGNVRDWCQESSRDDRRAAPGQISKDVEDRSQVLRGVGRVIRGGAKWDNADALTSTSRSEFAPANSGAGVGFRTARTCR